MNLFESQLAHVNRELAGAYGAPPLSLSKAVPAPAVRPERSITMSGSEFMLKALTAQAAGYITAAQLSEAEYCINARQRPPEPIVRAVVDRRAYSPWG